MDVGRRTSVLGQVAAYHARVSHTYSHGGLLCGVWDAMHAAQLTAHGIDVQIFDIVYLFAFQAVWPHARSLLVPTTHTVSGIIIMCVFLRECDGRDSVLLYEVHRSCLVLLFPGATCPSPAPNSVVVHRLLDLASCLVGRPRMGHTGPGGAQHVATRAQHQWSQLDAVP